MPKAKCRTRKIYHLRKKSNWEAVRTYLCLNDKNKKEYKDKNVCENAWGN